MTLEVETGLDSSVEAKSFEEKIKEKVFSRKATKQLLATVDSGEISLELGADGIWLRFDCDCIDALPYCQAQCCGFFGTVVHSGEIESGQIQESEISLDEQIGKFVMARGSDGFCKCLDRDSRSCKIYDRRPSTCQNFHCTRGANMRGHKVPNHVTRQPSF